jgi:hypothetical protein
MTGNKTVPNARDVIDFLVSLDDDEQRRDSEALIGIMSDVSGEPPVMWGTSIIGFGQFTYRYASGRTGDWMKIGFSPRKGKLSLYITYDASRFSEDLKKLGKHSAGKGCIYITRLSDVDLAVLRRIIKRAYDAGYLDDQA